MLKITNRKALAEAFARQTHPRGKAAALSFDGKVCYSYGQHFPVAVIDPGERVAHVNTDKYSSSTSRHQSEVKGALTRAGYTFMGHDTATMLELARAAS